MQVLDDPARPCPYGTTAVVHGRRSRVPCMVRLHQASQSLAVCRGALFLPTMTPRGPKRTFGRTPVDLQMPRNSRRSTVPRVKVSWRGGSRWFRRKSGLRGRPLHILFTGVTLPTRRVYPSEPSGTRLSRGRTAVKLNLTAEVSKEDKRGPEVEMCDESRTKLALPFIGRFRLPSPSHQDG